MRVARKILWPALALLAIVLAELLGLYAAVLREELKDRESTQLQALYQIFLAQAGAGGETGAFQSPAGPAGDGAQSFLENLKARAGSDWQLFLLPAGTLSGDTPSGSQAGSASPTFTLAASTMGETAIAGEDDHRQALSGSPALQYARSGGRAYTVYSAPLQNPAGEPVGVVDILFDRSPLLAHQQRQLLAAAGILLVSFVACAAGLAIFLNRALRPIDTLLAAANTIAAGNLDHKLPPLDQDEFGSLAGAFERMTAQMRNMISTLEQRVADRTRELEATIQVSRRVSTLLELDKLVKEVVDQLKYSFGFYYAHIYLFDETRQYLVMSGGTGEAGRIMLEQGHRIPRGKGLVGRAAESNTTVLVADVSEDPGWLPNPLLPETRCEVAIPLAVGDTVLGVLDVQHNAETGLIDQDVTLLQAVADQVALAVQNAKAYTQLQREAGRQAQIAALAQQIRATSTMEEALKVAVRELGHTLDAPQVRVRLIPKASNPEPLGTNGD